MENDKAGPSADYVAMIDLGEILGQHRTLAAIAGRCSAAQAATLARLREEKLYKRITPMWDEFCANYLKVSRAEADRIIRHWQEFGAAYFELSLLTRISPETYRAIAPAVKDGAIHHNGEAIPMTPENARRVAATVSEMRRALPRPEKASEDVPLAQRIDALDHRCTEFVAEFAELARQDRHSSEWLQFQSVLQRAQSELGRIAMQSGIR